MLATEMSDTMEKLGNTLRQDVGEREEAEMWRRRVMLSSCPGFLHRSKLPDGRGS